MTRKEINKHLDTNVMKDIVTSNDWSQYEHMSRADLRNFKLCAVWGYISPIAHFIVSAGIFKALTPKWVVALNAAIAVFDSECDIK